MLHVHWSDTEIPFGGAEVEMTETLLDGPHWCADVLENGGVSVTQAVGSGVDVEICFFAVDFDEKLDRSDGQRTVFAILEQWSGGSY